jgi:hypothetical protein
MEDIMAKAIALKASAPATRKTKPRKTSAPKPARYDVESWLAGYEAGLDQRPIEPPKTIEIISRGVPRAMGVPGTATVDRGSWLAGYVEGAGQVSARALANNIRLRGSEGDNLSDYCGVGSVAYSRGFKQGMRLAAQQAWQRRKAA